MRKIVVIAAGLLCLSLGVMGADWARVDVEGLKGRTKLTPVKCDGEKYKFIYQTWRGKFKNYCLSARLHPTRNGWTSAKLRFVPAKDGNVRILLLGRWMSKKDVARRGWYRVYFTKVEAEGAVIKNSDLTKKNSDGGPAGWQLGKNAKYTSIKDSSGKEVPALLVKCYDPAIQTFAVKKDKPVTITVSFRPEKMPKAPVRRSPAAKVTKAGTVSDYIAPHIKKDSEIQYKIHPSLFFGPNDIAALRLKSRNAYFANYTRDLIATAEYLYDVKFHDSSSFPFRENPNFQNAVETLTMAQVLSGEKKYGRRAINLVKKFVSDHYLKVPVRDSGKFIDWVSDANSISFILRPIALAYDILYNDMTPAERFHIRKGLTYFCKITYDMAKTEEYGLSFHKNYLAGQMGGLGLACMVLKDETRLPLKEWSDKALRESLAWCNVAVGADGMYPEGVTYLFYMLDNQLLFFDALQRQTGVNYFAKTNLKASIKWTLWSCLPWQYELDNFSDGRYKTNFRNILTLFQKNDPGAGDFLVQQLEGEHLRYRGNPLAVVFGHKPELDGFSPRQTLGLSTLLKHSGMAGFRSGWKADDMLLLTYATDYEYAAHSQADRGHFNMYAYGKKWATDSGYGNDGKSVNSATPSAAHSLVMIDGKGQGFHPGMRQAGIFADISDFIASDSVGYVQIDQKEAYDYYIWYSLSGGRKVFNPVERARRNLLFVNRGETPPYMLVYDDIRKDGKAHEYSWQMQSCAANTIAPKSNGAIIQPMKYSGKAVYAEGTGGWDNYVAPGFNGFRFNAGSATFKVSTPKAGNYYLWTFGRSMPLAHGEAELLVNGKLSGRISPGVTDNFCWNRYTFNRKKMHKPETVSLKQGENTLEFRNLLSGYKIFRGLLTTDKDFVPRSADAKPSGGIAFDYRNLTGSKLVKIAEEHESGDTKCTVTALYPKQVRVTTDLYQPSRMPLQPRLHIKTRAVAPNFLIMLYPHKSGMQKPAVKTIKRNGYIQSEIQWDNCRDMVTINLSSKILKINGIETDAKWLFCRFDSDGQLLRMLGSQAKAFRYGDKHFNVKHPQSFIYESNQLIISNY